MYRLVLYCLTVWLLIAFILSAFRQLPFTPQALLYSTTILLLVSWLINNISVRVFRTGANSESVYITALILTFLISPPTTEHYLSIIPFLILTAILASAGKFILAFGKKHIFNPAGLAVALAALTIGQSATWWVGTIWMLPFILIGGLLITRKIRRFDLVISFFVTALISIAISTFGHTDPLSLLRQIFVDSPIIFFALVMLIEPLTTPPTRPRRIIYGAITGALFGPAVHIGWLYSTPELALCVGNIFSWLMSPKFKYVLTLKNSVKIAKDTGEFAFVPDRHILFKPGQYMEWTLDHKKTDSRGNRRYLTIASSPTEKEILLGIKFDSKKSSSFKKALAELEEGKTILAGQLSGEFTLPKNKNTKLCFMAGGIGITPFRSMISYMIDKDERRDVTLIYSCKRFEEIAYTNLVHRAHIQMDLKTVCTLSDLDNLPEDWAGYRGFVDVKMILNEVPDYMERLFFVSGPQAFVTACEKVLFEIGVPKKNVKVDYFPGF